MKQNKKRKKRKHMVFNKLMSPKFTAHDQFGVLAPQFLNEGPG